MALPATASLPQNGTIVSRWQMATSGAGIIADAIGPNTLTNNGVVTSVPAQFGVNGALFNGLTQYLGITNGAQTGLAVAGNFTISVWVNFTTLSGSGGTNYAIASKYDNASGAQRSWLFRFTDDKKFVSDTSSNGTNDTNQTGSAVTITAGTWHLLTYAYNTAGTTAVYLDGVFVQNLTAQTSLFSSSTASFGIGVWGIPGAENEFFGGTMQDMVFWGGTTLSSGEVTSLYNAYFPPAITPSGILNMQMS